MKTTLLFLSVFLSASLFGQNVYIPDANFKAYLVGNSEINTNGDTEIQFIEASAFDGGLYCESMGISDLTGIEAFSTLSYLNFSDNHLTSIDLSQNTLLTVLLCANNQLTSLDLSYNVDLYYLACSNNVLTSLDLSQNVGITFIICFNNPLSCLNIANGSNVNMDSFVVQNNPNLTCIEVDDAEWSTSYWTFIDAQTSFSENCNNDCSSSTVGINELTTSKNLIQILDLMGRETKFKTNTALIYVYDDGSTEKVFRIE